jgi:thiamine pyrophosphate-dependent acetolactate synthase large subunit-like protein
MMRGADTLFLIGTTFPYAEFFPKEGAVKAVQIDIDARSPNRRRAVCSTRCLRRLSSDCPRQSRNPVRELRRRRVRRPVPAARRPAARAP